MSYLAFSQGIKSVPFVQRTRQSKDVDEEFLQKFKESERRLNILRTFGEHIDHQPTEEEMRNWLKSIRRA